jgi:cell division protein FtsW (lipid II flippase)
MIQGSRRFRWNELQLLLLPALFMLTGMFILILVDNGTDNRVNLPTVDSLVPAIGVIGALLVMHILLTILLPQADQVLLPIAGLLSIFGVLMALRLGPSLNPPSDNLGSKQLLWMLLGLVACTATIVLTRKGGLSWIRRYKYTFAAFGILLVGISLVRVLTSHIDFDSPTHDQLTLPGGIDFQPSELLKICLVIFFAAYVAENREILGEGGPRLGFISAPPLKQFGPLLLMLFIALVLFVGLRELGLAILIFGTFLSVLYLGSGRLLYVLWGAGLFAVGGFICYKLFTYAQARFNILGVDCQATDAASRQIILGPAYQVCQGLIAMGSGGVFGTGLGLGSPTNVPAVQTDLVFSGIGEEFGLLGIMGLIGLYIMLVHRGFHIASRAKTAFNQLLASGLTAIFAIQTMIIIAGNLKLFPLTGIPLPFITYGGSSLIANYIIIGLLLRVSAEGS